MGTTYIPSLWIIDIRNKSELQNKISLAISKI